MQVTTSSTRNVECPGVVDLFARIGARWTVQVIVALADRPYRFNELRRHIGGISRQMLARTLKSLANEGLVDRSVLPSNPPTVEYRISPLGRSLAESMRPLAQWAIDNQKDV